MTDSLRSEVSPGVVISLAEYRKRRLENGERPPPAPGGLSMRVPIAHSGDSRFYEVPIAQFRAKKRPRFHYPWVP